VSEFRYFLDVISPAPESDEEAIEIWRGSLRGEGGREAPEPGFRVNLLHSMSDGVVGVVVVGLAEGFWS